MGLFSWFAKETVGETLSKLGSGVSNVLDRVVPKKMSEAERWQKARDMMDYDVERGKLEVEDVNRGREMWMTFLRTQKIPWIARLLNSIYRPFCGFVAILYLTDQLWAQILMQYVEPFHWQYIKRDPVVDGLVAVIIYFFFGYRQRSKEKAVANIS